MKLSLHLKSFFPQLFFMLGGVVLGMSLFKLWYLNRIVNQKWQGDIFLGRSEYGGFLLFDAVMLLILCVIIWKNYQIKLALPILQLSEIIRRIQVNRGNFTTEISTLQCDEVRELSQATSVMLKQVNSLITQFHEVAQKMLEASNFVFSTSKNQSALLSDQVSTSNEMTTAIRELVMTAQHISEDVHAVVDIASQTLEFAEQGQNAVMNVVQSMEDIRQAFQRSSDKIIALGKQSEHINDVVKTIDRIIEDTKLIAFNATIEAARARDEGRGFGVVAIEIKRLAEEVFESTEDIKELIQEIQEASSILVLGTEEEMKTIYRGTLLAKEAGDSLKQIFAMVKLTTESAQRIASATQQQKSASEHVLHAVEMANQSIRRFSQESKQLAVTAAELSILADGLRQILARFGVQ